MFLSPNRMQAIKLVGEANQSLLAAHEALTGGISEDAEPYLAAAEEKARAAQQFSQDSGLLMEEVSALRHLATALFLRKRYPEAADCWQRVHTSAQSAGNLADQQDALESLGRVYLERGRSEEAGERCLEKAGECYGEALALFEARREGLAAEARQITFASEGTALYERLLQVHLGQGDPGAALEAAERAKSRAMLGLLGTTPLRRPQVHPDLAQREKALLAQIGEVAAAWRGSDSQDVALRNDLWNRWVGLHKELDRVWTEMSADESCAEYVALRRGIPPDLESTKKCLV